ncbi:hybrid sensor histidine kinase/response regulator [Alsobacter soli]|uniref:histidine kinase n=1 Tax=Alsobacter soli TaxID=2109933 RepID=A0A2T1HZJ1_9HYPH|nr:ATP-binding protein [Alsobacter soli]PSC06869.1 hybrid sensor histidine kinase/response regulator [Alsobacter soli]
MAEILSDAPSGRFRSIRTKLALLVAAAIGLAAAVSTALAIVHTVQLAVSSEQSVLMNTARVFAAAVSKGVQAGDQAAIYEALAGIRKFEGAGDQIEFVGVEDLDGRPLADLGSAPRLMRDARVEPGFASDLWSILSSRTLQASAPVGEPGYPPVARLIVIKTSDGLLEAVRTTLLVSVVSGLVALALGLLAASRLQRAITRPVVDLAATMARVRDGHDFRVAAKAAANDEVGQLVGSFNAMIAGIRERDVQLALHRERLEQDVSDRTRDLNLAKIAAENANAAKSDFLATMSHEIRTPMNGMLVMAELLTAGDLPARQRRYAEVIARSGQSLLAIINDILDFSKVEAGKMDIERIPVDPAETADTVLSLFWERAQKKGLDLAAQVAPDTPAHILADPVRLNQVIGNLVNNALKFTESGHVLLSIGRDPHDPSRLRFAVTDTGIGIPEDKIAGLFSAFTQVDQSTTRKFGGTGLGLAICKRLVEAMGGAMRVTSDVGRGSTFAFSIPVEGAATRTLARVPLVRGRAPRAIVAVRGEATARVVADLLAACGYAVERREADALAGAGLPECELLFAEGAVLAQGLAGTRPARVVALTTLGDGSERRLEARGLADAILARPLAHADLALLSEGLALGAGLAVSRPDRGGRERALPQFTGCRVLVADDSAVNREVAVEALARLGVQADVAADGREAIAAAERGGIHLILMDGSMPEIDGFEAARRIREAEGREGRARLPILALTAHVVGSAADLWRTAGMDGVLHKPFTIAALAESLSGFLEPAGQGAVAPQRHGASTQEPDPPSPAEGEGSATLLDQETFGELEAMAGADGGAFLRRVAGLYLEHAPRALAQLEASLGGDAADQARAAHALKSMSFNIGAAAVAGAAGACEAKARENQDSVSQEEAQELRLLLDATLEALRSRVFSAGGQEAA